VWDQVTTFLRLSARTAIVLALLVAIAAWVAGPSRYATRIRNLWDRELRGAGTRADESDFATVAIAHFVARSKTSLRLVGVGIAIVLLILWDHPKPSTVLGVGILLLLYLAAIEFLGRASNIAMNSVVEHGGHLVAPHVEGNIHWRDDPARESTARLVDQNESAGRSEPS
jgi:hypothetical protein